MNKKSECKHEETVGHTAGYLYIVICRECGKQLKVINMIRNEVVYDLRKNING